MKFNETNTVEAFVVDQLAGAKLGNSSIVEESPLTYKNKPWQYVAPQDLNRSTNQVLLEENLHQALQRLNPSIADNPHLADEVIYKLRAILLSVDQIGLVRANKAFHNWMCGNESMPFGENNQHVPIHLIDFENFENNEFIVTNQLRVHARETKIPDIVLYINGIPVVVGELKTPIRPSISWQDGANEIISVYENSIPQLFVPNILNFATEGKTFGYGGIRTPLQFWGPWRMDLDESKVLKYASLEDVSAELNDLLHPERLLDILKNFSLFSANNKKQLIKVLPRFQQYEGANKIVDRVIKGKVKKGLIWHFQGSGKSFLMVYAAQKLRNTSVLKSPTVIVLVDRTDLDTQISGTLKAADISNVVTTENITELQNLLERDTRKIIVSMIHKFRDAKPDMNTRDNIIVLVDEAHRTQEGDLGRQMRAALPNAFLFGLTGTPVNRADKNTFWAFGAEEDNGGYLSRYTFQDSIRDGATLPLHFEPRLVDVHLNKEELDKAFEELKSSVDLNDEDADLLNQKSAKMASFLKAPERVEKIVEDIAKHFREKVEPNGLKAMIVTPDRYACVQYKEELDRHFPTEASKVVFSTTANDDADFKAKWAVDKSQQEKIVEEFNQADSPLKFIIVTAKLLTGFDAPILQTLYLDKSLKDVTLLQAICRTNRLYPNKEFGRIVDYFGIFDDAAKALQFDDQTMRSIITNLNELKDKLPDLMKNALSHFDGVDRNLDGYEGIQAAQEKLKTDELKDAFAKDFKPLMKVWESLSPDRILDPYQADFKWLSGIFESVRPASTHTGKLLWMTLGNATTKLMHENIKVGDVHVLEEFILDADVIENIFNNPDPKEAKKIEEILVKRFKKYGGDTKFRKLSERLEDLRTRAEQGLITSIEFVKELCKLAKDTLQAEKELEEELINKTPVAALTELFIELKTDETPAVVERIVNDIDGIVRVVRFPGWQTTAAGEREVQKSLRKALLKYQLHKNEMLFQRAYEYIKEYY
ncbi:HsdR family type I site-specific deoxyribonuclease [Empedobacter stercoris]|uniref:type I restriction endonuclease subunit R n=1 Tax=Empedobacter stercoris TaxID=1628248 RepID=UPI001CE19FE6|nr:HsdR family type I site-specific deoxyribonuclease [Empedobacter stercoris]MCA4781805.1 HsdR family type I site-specific deoxyribonuclease [Empedobacter stercoris]